MGTSIFLHRNMEPAGEKYLPRRRRGRLDPCLDGLRSAAWGKMYLLSMSVSRVVRLEAFETTSPRMPALGPTMIPVPSKVRISPKTGERRTTYSVDYLLVRRWTLERWEGRGWEPSAGKRLASPPHPLPHLGKWIDQVPHKPRVAISRINTPASSASI